jgi:integrase
LPQRTTRAKRRTPGIEARHQRSCRDPNGERCNCKPTYRAWVYDRRAGQRVRKTFDKFDEAKAWRAEATVGLRRGTMKAPSRVTLREAAEAWLAGAEAGTIRTRSGDPYKPSAIRGYKAALNNRVLKELGAARLSDIRRVDVQDLADRMLAEGLGASTIRNALMPLRAIFRRAVARGEVAVNPTSGIELPAVRGRRDRIASPDEAAKLIAAVPEADRPLWATAMYAGLRRGELMALRWEDVDLAAGLIRVERSWDPKERVFVTPKSRAGRRTVPLPAILRDYLDEHKLRTGGDGLVFGRSKTEPFDASVTAGRAATAWKKAGLTPITLHEARHTFASLMIAAGVNAKALSTYMGHASVSITYDRYGHLMPGSEDEAAALLDAYLVRADTVARMRFLGPPG